MRILPPVCILFFLLISFSSCKKDNSGKLYPPGKTIIVVGEDEVNDRSNAVTWVNGVKRVLEGEGEARLIAVSGTDYYVAGQAYTGGGSNVVYWKNGKDPVNVSGITGGSGGAQVNGIALNGSDVYLSGTFSDFTGPLDSSNIAPVYWKNGAMTRLAGYDSGTAGNIVVSSGITYVAGSLADSSSVSRSVLWIDGVRNTGSADAITYIAVAGSDIYTIGRVGQSFIFYKNSATVTLPELGLGISITLNGSDVYVSGCTPDARPAYWKNGDLHLLASGPTPAVVSQLVVDGSDIYACGYNYGDSALLWKNGKLNVLQRSGRASAAGIAILQ